MYCTKCGKEISNDTKFCPFCGTATSGGNMLQNNLAANVQPTETKSSGTNLKLILIAVNVLLVLLIVVVIIVIKSRSGNSVPNERVEAEETIDNPDSDSYFGDQSPRVGKIITFGEYEQDGNTANGKEPIEWIVLDKSGGNTYLLLSLYVLDSAKWSDGTEKGSGALKERGSITYEDSSIRTFLNEKFSPAAFGDEELKYILPVSFREEDIAVEKGNSYATDLAFLIDGETLNTLASSNTNLYALNKYDVRYNDGWISVPTQYAISRGVPAYSYDEIAQMVGINSGKGGTRNPAVRRDFSNANFYSPYALRTRNMKTAPSKDAVRYVSAAGEYTFGNISDNYGIRPAIYITLSE